MRETLSFLFGQKSNIFFLCDSLENLDKTHLRILNKMLSGWLGIHLNHLVSTKFKKK